MTGISIPNLEISKLVTILSEDQSQPLAKLVYSKKNVLNLKMDFSSKFNIFFNISGQERFGTISSCYYRNADGALIVFDITRPETLSSVLVWKSNLENFAVTPGEEQLPCVLLANKVKMNSL